MDLKNLENRIGFQIGFLLHSGLETEKVIENLKDITVEYHENNSKLSNLEAIQEYLLEHGSNDEKINDQIKELKA